MRVTRPLFQVDPGWPFILAGLAVCVAGVLLPAQSDLSALQAQLDLLQGEEARAYARLTAHADFVDEIERGEAAVIKRLATAQLNLVPDGDTPVILAVSDTSPVTDWIDATVQADIRAPKRAELSTLSRLANGPYRLWLFGGGIMAVFIGLLMGPASARRRKDARATDAARRWTDGAGEREETLGFVLRSLTAETVDLEVEDMTPGSSEFRVPSVQLRPMRRTTPSVAATDDLPGDDDDEVSEVDDADLDPGALSLLSESDNDDDAGEDDDAPVDELDAADVRQPAPPLRAK